MFWRAKTSPVCRRLKSLLAVRDAWVAWELDGETWIETIMIVFEYDTDPAGSSFRADFLDQVRAVVREDDREGRRRVRIMPRSAVAG